MEGEGRDAPRANIPSSWVLRAMPKPQREVGYSVYTPFPAHPLDATRVHAALSLLASHFPSSSLFLPRSFTDSGSLALSLFLLLASHSRHTKLQPVVVSLSLLFILLSLSLSPLYC